MTPTTPQPLDPGRAGRRRWRPASFGPGKPRDIVDPIVEPVWEGRRVLVHLDEGELRIVDAEGELLAGSQAPTAGPDFEAAADLRAGADLGAAADLTAELGAIVAALQDAIRATEAIIDGVLTVQASRSGEGILPGEVGIPTASDLAAQLVFGQRPPREDQPGPNLQRRPGDRLAFVALDLLSVDGESLLGIPLLERKRLLESVLDEGPLVRRTAYVRLPIEPWLGAWRALGFRSIAYKAANSRYEPGRPNEGWATAPIPKR